MHLKLLHLSVLCFFAWIIKVLDKDMQLTLVGKIVIKPYKTIKKFNVNFGIDNEILN